ncbi:MAG: hypothetical protein V3R99_06165, partial [Thermoguttaceae bacterium]
MRRPTADRGCSCGAGRLPQRGRLGRHVRRLRLERLEDRRLLSLQPSVVPLEYAIPDSSPTLEVAADDRSGVNSSEQPPYVPGMGIRLSDDLFLAADRLQKNAPTAAGSPPTGGRPFGAQDSDTSETMIGDVHVTVVLMESDGGIDPQSENWTTAEIGLVKSEINEGLDWWETVFAAQDSTSTLDFTVDFTNADTPFDTDYEPITRSSDDQFLWIDQFLGSAGYSTGFDGIRQFNDDRRVDNNVDWAYTVFVVDSSDDANGEFTNGDFAYAYLGGPFLVMTYDNDGWGIGDMGQVFAHETAHVFYALDEYPDSASYYKRSGYYNTQNLNAVDNHPSPATRVASIMAEDSLQNPAYSNHTSSATSLEMLGWRDGDGDDIFDVLDVPLTLTGSGSYDDVTRMYTFTGSSSVETLDNLNPLGNGNAITLNEVDRLQYRLDDGDWIDAASYGTFAPTIDVRIGPLPVETRTIQIRTIADDSGATSNLYTGDAPDDLNLAVDQPSGWSDKIVLSSRTDTNTDDVPLLPTDTIYVDWA